MRLGIFSLLLGLHCVFGSHVPASINNVQDFLSATADWIKTQSPYPVTLNGSSVSPPCAYDIETFNAGFAQGKMWALYMRDADGKRETGILDGNVHAVGNFDECQRVKATQEKVNVTVVDQNGDVVVEERLHDFEARYCRIWGKFQGELADIPLWPNLGKCLPKSCTSDDVRTLSEGAVGSLPVRVEDVYCYEQTRLWDDGAGVAAFVVLMVFVATVVAATATDYTIHRKQQKSRNKQLETSENGVYGLKIEVIEMENAAEKQNGIHNTALEVEDDVIVNGDVNINNNNNSITLNEEEETYSPGMLVRTLTCFSLYTNGSRLLSTDPGSRGLLSLNGMRFLSMTWIIFGHTWGIGVMYTFNPREVITENLIPMYVYKYTVDGPFFYQFIMHIAYGTDTFFVLSACLVTMSFMRTLHKFGTLGTAKQMGWFYFHRYWRLTPVVILIIFIGLGLYPYLVAGPTPPDATLPNTCRDTWWMFLLYIQNFINIYSCMPHLWYLAVDMQCFIVAPIFIFFLYKYKYVGWVVLFFGWLGSLVSRTVLYTSGVAGMDFYEGVYVKPYTRFAAYAAGLAVGAALFKTKCKVTLHRYQVLLGWVLALSFTTYGVLGPWKSGSCDGCRDSPEWVKLSYDIIHRALFSIGVGWIVFACCTGYGGIANSFLSWKFFIPLSRLTYVGYIIHPVIMMYNVNYSVRPIYVDETAMMFLFMGVLLMTLLLAIPITLLFEVPFAEMEKVLFPKKK